ncbi:hypothetical protein VAE151_550355 [Vibrio aestuarianus]|uniref:Uncharacterized protein n=1 Tax=Vibrio aestuarianus TaxID=28171 RepID=A0ABN8TV26_9VIBR|nr:hypothetical protein VAE308_1050361 [Vibrio aestuarianus]CAH8195162.1 hypothetical protein VIBAE_A30954 [Vibrio aestuarianus subsp. francensis]CAH8195410.1 hypothetical protein VAE055_370356 [Vibrio aestuarianus]CAH8195567.1 hypothetical protein VAE032_270357 [Vibrio aestuarianus]CAH8195627.1 hypothetical protein VAE128_460360 [Vibrio aestuarianus]
MECMSAITSKRSVTLFSLNNYLMGEVKFSIVTGYRNRLQFGLDRLLCS